MARHAVVDLAQVLARQPTAAIDERLSDEELERLRVRLAQGGLTLRDGQLAERLADLRQLYEPYAAALAAHLALTLPMWVRTLERPDNWQTSAWKLPRRPTPVAPPARPSTGDEAHF